MKQFVTAMGMMVFISAIADAGGLLKWLLAQHVEMTAFNILNRHI